MWLTNSSIGRKFVMALTGAFLILFVTFHVLMNGVAIFWPAAYNAICEFLGANWYALIGSAILAGGFLLHILYALWLTWQNRRARGADRYEVTSRPKQVEWSSKNMLVLGIVVICFLVLHMYQFWAKMQLTEVLHLPADMPPAAGTLFLQQVFSCPWMVIIYIIGFAALWMHMTHGFWSMFQSSGLDNSKWFNRLKVTGNVWATVVCALFVIEAVVFTVNAKKGTYLTCPDLQEQYIEMDMSAAERGEGYTYNWVREWFANHENNDVCTSECNHGVNVKEFKGECDGHHHDCDGLHHDCDGHHHDACKGEQSACTGGHHDCSAEQCLACTECDPACAETNCADCTNQCDECHHDANANQSNN